MATDLKIERKVLDLLQQKYGVWTTERFETIRDEVKVLKALKAIKVLKREVTNSEVTGYSECYVVFRTKAGDWILRQLLNRQKEK